MTVDVAQVRALMERAASSTPLATVITQQSGLTFPGYPTVAPAPIEPRPPWFGWIPGSMVQTSVVSRTVLNRTATTAERRQATVAAEGTPLPLIYGRTRKGGMVFAATTYQNSLLLGCAWCQGEVEEIEKVLINDVDASTISGVTVTNYTGTDSQTVDATLAAAIPGYEDTLTFALNGTTYGIAYSVIRISASADVEGFPRIEAILQGLKCLEVSGGVVQSTRSYSTNPGRALVDLLASDYGLMLSVNGAAAQNVIDACDATMVDGSPRRSVNLAIMRFADSWSHVAALAAYASAWTPMSGDEVVPVPDTTATSARSLDASDFPESAEFRVRKRGMRDVPTVMRVYWTDTSTDPWRDAPAIAYASGVEAGTTAWVESQVYMPGIVTYAQAYREAVERLNKLTLLDLEVEWTTYDEGLQDLVGDVLTITHPIGLASKDVRLTACDPVEPGRWRCHAVEYDPIVYSDSVEGEPGAPDTDLPNPFDVPLVAGFAATEEPYQLENGTFSSRIRLTWNASTTYPFAFLYEWQLISGATLIYSGTSPSEVAVTGPVQEGVTYTCKVRIRGLSVPATGDYAQANITAYGKSLIPTDVPSVSGFEVGGEVRLSWQPSVDLDIWRYEVRYGATGGSWSTATLIDRVDGLRLTTRDIPPGTWVFYVKCLDSIGQYSTNAATVTITVTLDSNAFFVGAETLTLNATGSTSVQQYTARDESTEAWTAVGAAVSALFPTTATSYNDPFLAYDNAGSSVWVSEVWDTGDIYTGTWRAVADTVYALGTGDAVSTLLELSPDNSDWSDSSTTLSRNATARYARVRVTAATGNTLYVDGGVTVRLDVQTQAESMSGASHTARTCLVFDGVADYIDCGDDTAINTATAGYAAKTWESRFITGSDVATRQIVYKQGAGFSGLSTYIDGGRIYVGAWTATGTIEAFLSATCAGGSYYHAIGVFDGTAEMVDLYVNGTHIGQSSLTTGIAQHTGNIVIGKSDGGLNYHDGDAYTSNHFAGSLFTIRQYNRAITASEAAAHASGTYSSASGLVQLYELNTGTGTTADDTSSTNNDATITGATWGTAADPDVVITAGSYKFLKSLSIQPQSSEAITWHYDNIILGDPTSFCVYVFTLSSGAQVAKNYTARLEGI